MPVTAPAHTYSLKGACVKESLRFTSAAPGRLPRVVPNSGAPFVVDGQVIPPGVSLPLLPAEIHSVSGILSTAKQMPFSRWITTC